MATNLVPPKGSCIVRCDKCDGLYVPERTTTSFGSTYFEQCPFCGFNSNTYRNTIPVWKYNLLKFFRSGQHVDEIEAGLITFSKPEKLDITTNEPSPILQMVAETKKVIKKNKTKQPKTPAEDDYWLKITFEKPFGRKDKRETSYRLYGVVDSIADLPVAEEMPDDAAYYVEAKKKFCTKYSIWWNLENDLDARLYGSKRDDILKEAYDIKEYFEKVEKSGVQLSKPIVLSH